MGNKNPSRFTPYSEIAHKGDRREDKRSAAQIKEHILNKLR